MQDDDLIKGGQGRSAEDVREDGIGIISLVFFVLILMAFALVFYGCSAVKRFEAILQ